MLKPLQASIREENFSKTISKKKAPQKSPRPKKNHEAGVCARAPVVPHVKVT